MPPSAVPASLSRESNPPSRTASPPQPSSSVKMDGKEFFKQARLRLTYEQFNQFLSNIKRLNDHAQSRDDTLLKAQEIFGSDNEDLFVSFKSLLSNTASHESPLSLPPAPLTGALHLVPCSSGVVVSSLDDGLVRRVVSGQAQVVPEAGRAAERGVWREVWNPR
eukprot:CAMPEP_0174738054 /NCGR_PEP_ID=MMETSP1094-20130205/69287_1 /TAXON_ID=156173 /ORGANISM="Chrysochromulina brevifilum, Strain UTEX LB 985" /LENGTH=163 /DNA_ID=CAMNT_0015941391 /DNA_START=44 /DNA_END=536 /DNA_ORIENTATION=+